jgi:hypothetical protein
MLIRTFAAFTIRTKWGKSWAILPYYIGKCHENFRCCSGTITHKYSNTFVETASRVQTVAGTNSVVSFSKLKVEQRNISISNSKGPKIQGLGTI